MFPKHRNLFMHKSSRFQEDSKFLLIWLWELLVRSCSTDDFGTSRRYDITGPSGLGPLHGYQAVRVRSLVQFAWKLGRKEARKQARKGGSKEVSVYLYLMKN